MQYHNDDDLVVFSATDLNHLAGCARLNALEIDVMMGRRPAPPRSPGDVYSRAGLRHEREVLEDYIRQYGINDVVVIEESGAFPEDKKAAAAKTVGAIRAGVSVIHQGVLWWDMDRGTAFLGYADFLIKQPDGSYQVIDAKLAKEVKEKYIVQIGIYAEVLERMTGIPAVDPAIQLGTKAIVSLPLAQAKAKAERLTEEFRQELGHRRSLVVEPPRGHTCSECKYCRWLPECEQIWQERGDLGLVAGVGGKYISTYEAAGYRNMDQLGNADPDDPPEGVSQKTWAAHVLQARLQAEATRTGHIPVEIVDRNALAGLPSPGPGDLYFDIEGYAITPIQLEYLFGLWDGSHFLALWAHTPDEEAAMLTRFVEEVQRRLAIHPGLHIYYYNHYETQALRRLARTHNRFQDIVDNLCDTVMINLMPVVKDSIKAGLPGYGLKELERLHGFTRAGEIKTAGDSVDLYDQWLYSPDHPQELLDRIAEYNLEDLQSTQALHLWLNTLKGL